LTLSSSFLGATYLALDQLQALNLYVDIFIYTVQPNLHICICTATDLAQIYSDRE